MRHADARYHPRGANGGRPHADLHGIGAGVDEGVHGFGGRHVAAHDLQAGVHLLGVFHRLQDAGGVAVSRVDNNDIHAAALQFRQPLAAILSEADRGADPQAPQGVLAGQGIAPPFLDVLDGNEPFQVKGVVHHQKLLDTVLVQEFLRLVQAGSLRHRDQVFGGHERRNRLLQVAHETQVAVRENPRQLRALGDGDAGNPVTGHHLDGFLHPLAWAHGNRVHDHAAFGALDLVDLGGLRLDTEVLVDDADAALLRQGNGQIGLGDGIHGGADQRDVEFDFIGQQGRDVRVTGEHVRMRGQQQHVVKRQALGQRLFKHGGLHLEP